MGIVYSTQFILDQGVVGDVFVTVPVGFVAVVRELDVVISGVHTPASLDLTINDVRITTFEFPSSGTNAVGQWVGRAVALAGQTIGIVSAPAKDICVSGYLLSLP